MARFHQTFFITNPDELLNNLYKRNSSVKKDLDNKRLKVCNVHFKMQTKQFELNKISKIIFDTTNRFLDSFEPEFKTLMNTLKTNTTGDVLATKCGEHLKQIVLFSGTRSNSYMTCSKDKKDKSEEHLKTLINNLNNQKNDETSDQYSNFIDSNFSQLFRYNLSNLSHVARAFLSKEDFHKMDSFFLKVNNCELINKQFINKCDVVSHEILTLASKFCNDEIAAHKKTNNNIQKSKVNYVLVVKGRNIPSGTILKLNKDNYRHYWKGLAKAKKIDVLLPDDRKGDVAKDNVVFLEEY